MSDVYVWFVISQTRTETRGGGDLQRNLNTICMPVACDHQGAVLPRLALVAVAAAATAATAATAAAAGRRLVMSDSLPPANKSPDENLYGLLPTRMNGLTP